MHAYCLFCETQRCGVIAATVETVYHLRCIRPQIVQRKWVKGVPAEVRHDWLPGYLFVYMDEPVLPRFRIDGIIRVLGGGELTGEDLAFAGMLFQNDGLLGTVRLVQEGDRCAVNDAAWAGMSGTVIKMDRGRKRCCVAFEFDGTVRNIWVGYEMVQPETLAEPSLNEENRQRG